MGQDVNGRRLRSMGLEAASTDGSHHECKRRRVASQGRIVTVKVPLSRQVHAGGRYRSRGSSGNSHDVQCSTGCGGGEVAAPEAEIRLSTSLEPPIGVAMQTMGRFGR